MTAQSTPISYKLTAGGKKLLQLAAKEIREQRASSRPPKEPREAKECCTTPGMTAIGSGSESGGSTYTLTTARGGAGT